MIKFLSNITLLLFCAVHSYGQVEELKTQIEQIIKYDTKIEFDETPGMIISIIDGDSIWHIDFGARDLDSKEKLSKSDIFEVGSVTKVFTSSLIDILEDENLINKDELVNNLLPMEFRNPRLDQLTIRDLIHHNSQLPKRPSFFGKYESDTRNPYKYYKTELLLEFYKNYIPEDEDFFVYSHTNYALLEYIIERLTKQNFGDLLNEKIFTPLSMNNSFIEYGEKRDNVISPGYNRTMDISDPWQYASFKGSEALKSSSEDLCKFIKANLGISHNHLDTIFQNNFNGKSVSFNDRLFISEGWHIIEVNDKKLITHSGRTSGHTAFIAFIRETKTGVVVLSNSAYGSQDLGILILRMLNFNWKRDS